MDRLAGQPIFSLGERIFSWEDVVLTAYFIGGIAGLERRIKSALATENHLAAIGQALTDEEVEQSGNAWRYERDLISADDLERWLQTRAISLDEWSAYIRRTASASRRRGRIPARVMPRSDEIDDVMYTEAMCSGTVTELTDWLAGRAAVSDRARSKGWSTRAPARATVRSAIDRLPTSIRKRGLFGTTAAECAERAGDIVAMDITYRRFVKTLAGDVLQREIDAHALEWTRFHAQALRFETEGPAREAVLLIRNDGLSIAKVATLARTAVVQRSHMLEDVADPLRDRLVAAQPGELLGPWPDDDGFSVMLVTDRVVPSADDREIRSRAREGIERRVVGAEIEKRIRWHERF
jgi:hypothetical protein